MRMSEKCHNKNNNYINNNLGSPLTSRRTGGSKHNDLQQQQDSTYIADCTLVFPRAFLTLQGRTTLCEENNLFSNYAYTTPAFVACVAQLVCIYTRTTQTYDLQNQDYCLPTVTDTVALDSHIRSYLSRTTRSATRN